MRSLLPERKRIKSFKVLLQGNQINMPEEYSEDYPLGGMVEPYDIEREKELTECTCQYHETKNYISESGLIHNRNCPAKK